MKVNRRSFFKLLGAIALVPLVDRPKKNTTIDYAVKGGDRVTATEVRLANKKFDDEVLKAYADTNRRVGEALAKQVDKNIFKAMERSYTFA